MISQKELIKYQDKLKIDKSTFKNINYLNILNETKMKLIQRHWDSSLHHQLQSSLNNKPEIILEDLKLFFKISPYPKNANYRNTY
jgi:hypothetical protein